jgi:hypothetical protein
MKNVVMKILGPRNSGRLDYFLRPELRSSWGGPFNGQVFRQRIFSEIISALPFDAIVETGTYHGTTTVYLAATGLPVLTVETNPRFHAYSALRFRRENRRIQLYEGDTLWFLRMLSQEPQVKSARLFFYLDAHWDEHLPLREELEIVFDHWRNAVVMVDDFQVPGTTYGYDDYGPTKTLNLDYLRPLTRFSLTEFFPAVGADEETGGKRGCVVLARDPATVAKLRAIPSLRCLTLA